MRGICWLVAALVFATGCLDVEDAGREVVKQAVKKAVKAKAKAAGVDVKLTDRGLTIRRKGKEYTIEIGAMNGSATSALPRRFPAYPGAELIGYIEGINEDTVMLASEDGVERIEAFYTQALQSAGFTRESFMAGPGAFTGVWALPETGQRFHLHTFATKDRSRIILIASRL